MAKIRILIVEDNRLLREGISIMLEKEADIKVTAAFGDCEKIPSKIRETKPNMILLDIGLGNQNSLKVLQNVKKNFPAMKVIVMDLIPNQEDVLDFVQAGVSGFILKDATLDEFLNTIRLVSNGGKILPPNLTNSLFSQILDHALSGKENSKIIQSVRMTKREKQVTELIADGFTNKEIAQKLNLSTYTVKSHVHNILEKLALRTRVQIANYAFNAKDYQTAVSSISLIDK